MNLKSLPYSSSIALGAYMYILYQVVYFLRFGRLLTTCVECAELRISNIEFMITNHLVPYLIGVGSVLITLWFIKKADLNQKLALIGFIICIPVSFITSLGGGLLGGAVSFTFGLVPFVVTYTAASKIKKYVNS